ncbi:hypothetical protein AB0F81_50275 [Actinoplanes sp. NPDC024001]|uniref:DUF4097 family beta strand repeat-containing protein n=1 Tax=Actinoplanes sp. NPDC024001 TaxID=3154598 RepID=UPI0033F755B1
MTRTEVPRHPRAVGLLLGGILTGALLAAGSTGLWLTLAGPEPLHADSRQQTYREPVTGIDISVGLRDSTVTLINGQPGAVTVRQQLAWSRAEPVLEDDIVGRTLRIRSSCPPVLLPPAGQCRADLVVEVPPGATVRADVAVGRIRAERLTGAVDLTAYGGDITVSDHRGRLRARSDGGNITGTELAGAETDAEAEWGDVNLRYAVVPTVVQATSGTGDVSIIVPPAGTGADGYRVRADTGGGRHTVDVPQDSAGRHTIVAHAEQGDVTVRHRTSG